MLHGAPVGGMSDGKVSFSGVRDRGHCCWFVAGAFVWLLFLFLALRLVLVLVLAVVVVHVLLLLRVLVIIAMSYLCWFLLCIILVFGHDSVSWTLRCSLLPQDWKVDRFNRP